MTGKRIRWFLHRKLQKSEEEDVWERKLRASEEYSKLENKEKTHLKRFGLQYANKSIRMKISMTCTRCRLLSQSSYITKSKIRLVTVSVR